MIKILANAWSWWVLGNEGWSTAWAIVLWLWFGANWKLFPKPQPPVLTSTQPQWLSHSCYHHCLFMLNYCFSPRAQNPCVKCFLSAHLQVLQHNYLDMQSFAYNWEISQKHLHIYFFSPGPLEIQLYCELNSTLGELCVINVWIDVPYTLNHHQKYSLFHHSRFLLAETPHPPTPHCSLQSAMWYFINAYE